ncbi:MAG: hypothetical protein AABX51_01410 [Nanoarchaeota archaeon]
MDAVGIEDDIVEITLIRSAQAPNPIEFPVFDGDYRVCMTQLREAGLVPMQPKDVMDARLRYLNRGSAVFDGKNENFQHGGLWKIYIDTDFGIAATRDTIYLYPKSELLRNISVDTELANGGILISPDNNDGHWELPRKSLEHILNRPLTKQDVEFHPFWEYMAGRRESPLRFGDGLYFNEDIHGKLWDYSSYCFWQPMYSFLDGEKQTHRMGFYMPADDRPILRPIRIGGLGGWGASAGVYMGEGNTSRLVGMDPKSVSR